MDHRHNSRIPRVIRHLITGDENIVVFIDTTRIISKEFLHEFSLIVKTDYALSRSGDHLKSNNIQAQFVCQIANSV